MLFGEGAENDTRVACAPPEGNIKSSVCIIPIRLIRVIGGERRVERLGVEEFQKLSGRVEC